MVSYEAGQDGFWICRALQARQIECYIVDPASIPVERHKRHAKTDRLDAIKLVTNLRAWLRGEGDRMHVVRVPRDWLRWPALMRSGSLRSRYEEGFRQGSESGELPTSAGNSTISTQSDHGLQVPKTHASSFCRRCRTTSREGREKGVAGSVVSACCP